MKTPKLYIHLDQRIPSFFPGQTIVGQVVLNNDKPKELKNITITFEGTASVHWTENVKETVGTGKSKRTTSKTIHLTSKENYFNASILLFGGDGKRNSITLPTGTITYPFQFTLPVNLPSSFTGRHGMVHYLMEARVKRSKLKTDLTSVVPFTVNGILDLNFEPGVAQSVCYEKQKNICCLCCKSGPVGYKIALQRTGFVPGEYVSFNAEFLNYSRRKIKGVTVTLIQISNFYAQGRTRSERKNICSATCPELAPGDSDFWGGDILRLPALPPTRLASCRIIDVQYIVKFEMDLSGLTMNMVVEIPITIGTIPFRNTFNFFMPTSEGPLSSPAATLPIAPLPSTFNQLSVDQLPGYSGNMKNQTVSVPSPAAAGGSQVLSVPSAPVFDMYPDLPPPTYAEAVQNEKFEYNLDEGGNNNGGNTNLGFSGNNGPLDDQANVAGTSSPLASAPHPPGYDYVPNYITYGFSKGK